MEKVSGDAARSNASLEAGESARRRFLRQCGVALCGLANLLSPAPVVAAAGHRDEVLQLGELAHAELELAALGARFTARNPAVAEHWARNAEREFRSTARRSWQRTADSELHARLQWIRTHLRDPNRIASDFERAEVLDTEGWILARSEGVAAIYLSFLIGGSASSASERLIRPALA
jgi:hypothetical protein